MKILVANLGSTSLKWRLFDFSNGGERILLTFGKNVPIQDFTFNDKWYPLSDGQGHSLEIIDPKAATTSWNGASAWQASQNKGGTPGR